jgi:tetratricopeptide (TPR) repeat protein
LLTQIATLAERAAAARHDPVGRARALTSLAMADARRGRIDLAKQRLAEAMTIRMAHGDQRAEASTLDNLGLVHYRAGEPDVAFACYARALRLHREYDRPTHAATTMHNLSAVYEQLGRPAAAERFLRRSLALRVSTGDRFGEACTLVALGRILATAARSGPASSTLIAGIDMARRVGYWEAEWDGLICRAEIARRNRDLTAAAADLDRAASLAKQHRDPYALRLTTVCKARLAGAAAPAEGRNKAAAPEVYIGTKPEIEMFLRLKQ